MRLRESGALLTLALLLASCGGSGGSGVVANPTPSPTPSPSPSPTLAPSPTPTPSPTPAPSTVSIFPLNGTATLDAIASVLIVPYDTLGGGFGFRSYLTTSIVHVTVSSRTTDEWRYFSDVLASGVCSVLAPSITVDRTESQELCSTSGRSLLQFSNIFPGYVGGAGLNQRYVSYAYGGAGDVREVYVFGYPTLAANLTTVKNLYSATLRGVGFPSDFVSPGTLPNVRGTGTVALNPTALTGTVDLDVTSGSGASAIPWNHVRGTGALDLSTGLVSGTLASAEGDVTGSFSGQFYGPNAAELGLRYYLKRTQGSVTIWSSGVILAN